MAKKGDMVQPISDAWVDLDGVQTHISARDIFEASHEIVVKFPTLFREVAVRRGTEDTSDDPGRQRQTDKPAAGESKKKDQQEG